MMRNEGPLDRGIRTVAGLGAAAGSVAAGVSSAGGAVLMALAVILLATAAAGFCPLYWLLGISTGSPGSKPTRPATR